MTQLLSYFTLLVFFSPTNWKSMRVKFVWGHFFIQVQDLWKFCPWWSGNHSNTHYQNVNNISNEGLNNNNNHKILTISNNVAIKKRHQLIRKLIADGVKRCKWRLTHFQWQWFRPQMRIPRIISNWSSTIIQWALMFLSRKHQRDWG